MVDDTFSQDRATSHGGGVFNTGGTVTITDDTFSQDRSGNGAGLDTTDGVATMTDDTFWRNRATTYGGGVVIRGGTATMTDDSLVDDTATTAGGGVFNIGGTATIDASINNSGCSGILLGSYNVVTTSTCAGLGTEVTPFRLDVTTVLGTNTSAGPETLAIGPTSPALDEVPMKACTVATDERGYSRPGDRANDQRKCDAGAYELQHTATTLDQRTPTSGSVTHRRASAFQLAVTNPLTTTGKVRFHTTGTVPLGVSVSATGRIDVAKGTADGTYTLTGTDVDPLHDAGTWTFVLHVTG